MEYCHYAKNPQINKKLSALTDAFLAHPRGGKSPWNVGQNNVVNHLKVRSNSQLRK